MSGQEDGRRTHGATVLLCLPPAGQGTEAFRGWAEGLGPGTAVRPVALPGREARSGEPALRRMPEVVSTVADALPAIAGPGPLAVFGQGMGGLIGFELAVELRRRRLPEPACLIVSGAAAPSARAAAPSTPAAPGDELLAALQALDRGPLETLEELERVELLLPTVRADFELCATHVPSRAVLRCPVTAIVADGDPSAPRSQGSAWSRHTTGAVEVHAVPARRSALTEARGAVLDIVARALAAAGPEGPGAR